MLPKPVDHWKAERAIEKYVPSGAHHADKHVFGQRVSVCQACPRRHKNHCVLSGKLVSVLARPADAACVEYRWPGDPPKPALPLGVRSLPSAGPASGASVVIVSHNYGRYLPEAIESVLGQSVRPVEVVVVDDSSDDDTGAIAAQYGLPCIRGEWRNVHQARRAGFEATRGNVLCFLDADDLLPANYLERGLPLFKDMRVGVVHSDMQEFGASDGLRRYDGGDLDRQNYIHAGSLVRRAALEESLAFEASIRPQHVQDDWFLWRTVTRSGWKVAKSSAVYRYRRHEESASRRLKRERVPWFELAAVDRETITIFIPLAGRVGLWPELQEFLERQTWPRPQCRLVLCDTSGNTAFGVMLREWALRSGYPDVRVYAQQVGASGLADANRHDERVKRGVRLAMPRIYNRMAREVGTEFVWIVEDDILPPEDAAERLLRGFDGETAAVSGAYRSRFQNAYVAWDASGHSIRAAGDGLAQVGGTGFGCLMVRRSVLKDAVLTHDGPRADYDPNFFLWVRCRGLRAKLDWSVRCEHREVLPDRKAG